MKGVFDECAECFLFYGFKSCACFLVDPKQEWSVLGLSKEAQTGYGHTYRVVKTLLRMGVCRKTEGNRVVVINAGELLTRWASYYDFALLNKMNAYYSLDEDLDGFGWVC